MARWLNHLILGLVLSTFLFGCMNVRLKERQYQGRFRASHQGIRQAVSSPTFSMDIICASGESMTITTESFVITGIELDQCLAKLMSFEKDSATFEYQSGFSNWQYPEVGTYVSGTGKITQVQIIQQLPNPLTDPVTVEYGISQVYDGGDLPVGPVTKEGSFEFGSAPALKLSIDSVSLNGNTFLLPVQCEQDVTGDSFSNAMCDVAPLGDLAFSVTSYNGEEVDAEYLDGLPSSTLNELAAQSKAAFISAGNALLPHGGFTVSKDLALPAPGETLTYLVSAKSQTTDGRSYIYWRLIVQTSIPNNAAPEVDAGGDQEIELPNIAELNGTVGDDGLPYPPGEFTVLWSQASGPGNVIFLDPNASSTTASFSEPGSYVLRLTADDSEFQSSDDITITVIPDNQAPVVDAGEDQSIDIDDSAFLDGTVTDDDLPNPGVESIDWSKISGPGDVSFADPHSAATTATFTDAGTYVLLLEAYDGELSGSDEITITVNDPNQQGRATDGLVVLYDFSEGSGSTVLDISNVGTPMDLSIGNTGAVSWLSGSGISVNSSTIISSTGAATKVISEVKASNEITVEAWAKPISASQTGPARIVTLSADTGYRNFTLGQRNGTYDFRLRTTTTTDNGSPSATTGNVIQTNEPAHIVYTRDMSGSAKIYVDGILKASATIGGNLSNWSTSYKLALANEITMDRTWLGEIYLVAVYDKALTAQEVEQNRLAGYGPLPHDNRPPVVDAGPDQTVQLTQSAVLNGAVSDDNLPNPGVESIDWSKESGPGDVIFADPDSASTTATFSEIGSYVLKLTADDGEFQTFDLISISVVDTPVGEGVLRPWDSNPRYWQYKGAPVLLIGGSKTNHIFSLDDLLAHLDEIKAAGGNYVRNTMSQREGPDMIPFERLPDGKFDLNQWNEQYWQRFQNMLNWTHERNIIVQIEVWDRFDYTDNKYPLWIEGPWNPGNNINYTYEDSGFANTYPSHPYTDKQPFFHSIPGMSKYDSKYDTFRLYQEKFVDKMLSYSLQYNNVLYCMNNETTTEVLWGIHWINFVRNRAETAGVKVYVTDMFDNAKDPVNSPKLRYSLDHPELYDFIEVSQVNSTRNETHWNRIQWVVQEMEKTPIRPLNMTKIYSDGSTYWGSGTPIDGVERFWRDLIAGVATARFHRPTAGIGLNSIAKASIAAARKVESIVKFWEVNESMDLLHSRDYDEAYLAADPGNKYILYFTDGGSIRLDLIGEPGSYDLHWVNISTGQWGSEETIQGDQMVEIDAPGSDGWVAAIVKTGSVEGDRTTLVVLPDTQNYAEKYPYLFNAQTSWIADNYQERNIAYVMHLGDITNHNNSSQWHVAKDAFSALDGIVPYALTTGNHDYLNDGGNRDTYLDEYFYVPEVLNTPTFGGVFEDGKLDNNYHLFRIGNQDWIILALEFGPRDQVVDWANQVLDDHSDRLAILITHAYLYSDNTRYDHVNRGYQLWQPCIYPVANLPGGVNDGEELWQKLVSKHANMMIVINGHVLNDGLGYLASTGDNGNTVHQMLVNFQMHSSGGGAYLRLLEFQSDGITVQVNDYSPYLDSYKTDPQNQFSFTLQTATVSASPK